MIRLYGAAIVAASLLSTACVSVEKGAKAVRLADGDILIVNALLVDGTGGPASKGSLLVRNGRIESIGNLSAAREDAARVIDAAGRVGHILDPRSGRPAPARWRSVSISAIAVATASAAASSGAPSR